MSKSHWSRATFLTRDGINFSTRKLIIIRQFEFEHSMSSSFQFSAKNGSPAFGNSLFDRCRHSPGRKIVVSFTTKYALSQNSRVKHQKKAKQFKYCLSFSRLRLEIDCYRGDVVSAGQLGATNRSHKSLFRIFFSIFELGGIKNHWTTGPSGNSDFCFHSTSLFPSTSPRGKLRVSRKQNSLFPLGPVIKCLLTYNGF